MTRVAVDHCQKLILLGIEYRIWSPIPRHGEMLEFGTNYHGPTTLWHNDHDSEDQLLTAPPHFFIFAYCWNHRHQWPKHDQGCGRPLPVTDPFIGIEYRIWSPIPRHGEMLEFGTNFIPWPNNTVTQWSRLWGSTTHSPPPSSTNAYLAKSLHGSNITKERK